MLGDFWKDTKQRVIEQVIAFGRDAGNVFQALGFWGVAFLLVEIILGLLPVVSVLTLGATVDAMIGARGIGVVTSDVNDQLIRWLVILVSGFLAYVFSIRFTGKAGEVGRGLRDVVIFSSLLLFLILAQQIFLAFVFLTVLLVDLVFAHNLRVRIASLLTAILVASLIAHTLVRFTVLRSFTVGEGLSMIAGVAMFVIVLKLRIAGTKLK